MASVTPARRSWAQWLKDRWPTALALGLSALTFGGSESEEGVAGRRLRRRQPGLRAAPWGAVLSRAVTFHPAPTADAPVRQLCTRQEA
jgi:hypothetical protein